MWAAVNTDNIHVAKPDPAKHRVIPVGASGNTYSHAMSKEASMNTASTLMDDDPEYYKGLTSSPTKPGTTATDPDLEMQKVNNTVQVQRSYSVRSD